MPPPPWTWIARSITRAAMFGTAILIAAIGPAGDLVVVAVHQPGGVQGEQAGLVDLDPGVGDPLPDHALLGQRAPERGALVGALAHQLERPLGGADRAHAVVDAARPSRAWAMAKPPPSSPRRFARGTRTSLKCTSQWPSWSL